MRNASPYLLAGSLSVLFAEVLSGASQTWFIKPGGLLFMFPLYAAHVLFFLTIALRKKRTSPVQLYLYGVVFALYESWVTKVLWAGNMDSPGPMFGTFLGLAPGEFGVLVFFWHPIMSFITPLLVYEALTGHAFPGHERLLAKTRKRSILIALYLLLIGPFIANGNGFNVVSADASLIGTYAIIAWLGRRAKDRDISTLALGKDGFKALSAYLALLYPITFLFLLPERIPRSPLPYISIGVFYALPLWLLSRTEEQDTLVRPLPKGSYGPGDLARFALWLLVAASLACLLPPLSNILLIVTYLGLLAGGTILFAGVLCHVLRP